MNREFNSLLNYYWVCFCIILLSILFTFCDVDAKKNKKSKKNNSPEPFWSDWGEWDTACSRTCGIGVRRRTRSCIMSTAGTTPKARMKSILKKIVSVNRNKRCPGNAASQAKNCDTGITCPIDGGWSAWESWECTITCGGGTGVKKRLCNNPAPAFKGLPCNGSSQETGSCNTHLCPDQIYTLTPNTAKDLNNLLQARAQNFNKSVGSKIRLPCGPKVVGKIYNEYPETQIYWTKNGKLLQIDEIRIKMTLTELIFEELKLEDNGIYACRAVYAPGVDKPVSVIALVAISKKPEEFVYEEEKLILTCFGEHLATIYKNLTQRWLKNQKVAKDFGNDSPAKWTRYEIDFATSNLNGVWSCEITDPISKRVWIANSVFLKVLPRRKIHEKILTNKKMVLLILFTVFVLFGGIGICFAHQIVKAKENSAIEFCKWSKIVDLEKEKFENGIPDWAREEGSEEKEDEESDNDDED